MNDMTSNTTSRDSVARL